MRILETGKYFVETMVSIGTRDRIRNVYSNRLYLYISSDLLTVNSIFFMVLNP